jgi:hypothetical protein
MPRKTSAQLRREIAEVLARPKTRRGASRAPAVDPHQQARSASDAAFRASSPDAHRRAAEAFRVSAQQYRKTGQGQLSDYQEKNARMHDREAQEAQFDWTSLASIVQDAARRTPRQVGNSATGRKVFAADAYRTLTPDERATIGAKTLPQFKQLLDTLNKRRLIILEGVDLPGIWVNNGRTVRNRAASQRLVQESEIESLGSPFHFILV